MQQPSRSKIFSRFSPAVLAVLFFGGISLLGDMVYEGARSANSQYFQLLGISGAAVGLVFGLGEFLGYCLRLLAGVASDKTGRHWTFMFIGYALLAVVPLMGFTLHWNTLVIFVLLERLGKALRNPAKDTVLSNITQDHVGVGFAFGLQEALDQVGAFLGPIIFTLVFYVGGSRDLNAYQWGYRLLIIPFIGLMLFLYWAYRQIQAYQLTPKLRVKEYRQEKLSPLFWLYSLFTLVSTAGFVNFSTTGYHLKARQLMSDGEITLLYAGAMAVDAVAALAVGKLYDGMKHRLQRPTGGIMALAAIPLLTALIPFLALSTSRALIIAGMMLFGVVMGMHETVMRSAIADITPYYKRGTGYGVFNAAYGLALMAGAFLMGKLYDLRLVWLIQALTVALQAGAVLLFIRMRRLIGQARPAADADTTR